MLAEACTVSPAVLFLGYTLTVSILPRQDAAVRANLALVLAIGLLDLVAVTVCALVLVESRTAPRLLMMLSFLFLLVGDVLLGLDYWTQTTISPRLFLLPLLGSALFFALAALHACLPGDGAEPHRPPPRPVDGGLHAGAHRLHGRLLQPGVG